MKRLVEQTWTERYLALLGLQRESPSFEALSRITRRHLETVAFENVSSVLRRAATPEGPVPPLDRDAVLRSWEEGSAGGVCFQVTEMVTALLSALGYDARPVLSAITFPGSHQAVLVTFPEGRCLVDLGNGAPFFEPISLQGEQFLHHAGLGYRFRPHESDREAWWQDRLIEGEWRPFFRYQLRPASEVEREAAYQRHHTPGRSWVVDNLFIVHCRPDEVLQIRDDEFVRYTEAGKTRETIEGLDHAERIISEAFGLPELPVRRAIEALAGASS